MSNKFYQRGVRKEYKIVHQLKEDDWIIAQRSAGSKSPIDIFAVNRLTRVIKFIQAKPNNFSEFQINKIMKEWGWLNGGFRVEFEVI